MRALQDSLGRHTDRPVPPLQLAQLLDSDKWLWAEAFWAANETVLTTAFLEQCGTLGDAAERDSGAQSPPHRRRRTADAAGAEAVWAALLAEGRELADAVLGMHPAITAAFERDHHPTLTARLMRLPVLLHVPALARVLRSPELSGPLRFSIGPDDSELVLRALRDLPGAANVELCFEDDSADATLVDMRAVARAVGPTLRALQGVPQVRRLCLSGGGQALCAAHRSAFTSARPDLSPLTALTQLAELSLSTRISKQHSAVVVTRLTSLQILELHGYRWPLGPCAAEPGHAAADSSAGGVPAGSMSGGRCEEQDAEQSTDSATGYIFPQLRELTLSLPTTPLPVAPRLEVLVVGLPRSEPGVQPLISERLMCSVCSCAAAARTALTSLTLHHTHALACRSLGTELAHMPYLRRLQLGVKMLRNVAGYSAVTSALRAATALTSLRLEFGSDRHRSDALRARALCDGIAALTGLQALKVTAEWDLPALWQDVACAAVLLPVLASLQLCNVDPLDRHKCSVTLGPCVQMELSWIYDVRPYNPEVSASCSCAGPGLLQTLAAWVAERSGGAEALTLSIEQLELPGRSGLESSVLSLQALRSVHITVGVAAHSEVVQLARVCCGLRQLTSLTCQAKHLELPGWGWDVAAPDAPLPLSALTGLRQLTLGGVRCGKAFYDSMQQALERLQHLESFSLHEVQIWPRDGNANLAAVYACLPTTLTQLRFAMVSVGGLAERLPLLVRLQRLQLRNEDMCTADEVAIAAASKRLPSLESNDPSACCWWLR